MNYTSFSGNRRYSVQRPESLLILIYHLYRPRSKGDNRFGSIRPSVRLSVCVFVFLGGVDLVFHGSFCRVPIKCNISPATRSIMTFHRVNDISQVCRRWGGFLLHVDSITDVDNRHRPESETRLCVLFPRFIQGWISRSISYCDPD